ncbi:DegT/DnrJ/EryC1/StrS family aminotransferase [Acinetobacter bereziniae]|jgi:dTDP-4-amino-4,6-dideoxygalactose transaminase|uniref:DegT/DnrJ/EryC1/StrS family aminotransferase n=2 Tax=Acinetobacter TaxID=469 RepID=UPI0021D1D899|nr:DegT/DnrJ/EryC1/StrS family aminotransferase [Acinetobacter bereziniae]MCU4315999.1 DegT/DnrJ/EryC1/StrS family aminotransferase [Acinetobacter bereziniae]
MNETIYVTQPVLPELDDFIPYLEQIWKNKVLTNCGPLHQQLEQELCDYLGVDYISLFNNGTIALVTALQALNLTEGEVITTPYTFVATAHSIVWNKLTPVFVDIDSKTSNIDPEKVEKAITERTVAIMPVHCYGIACDVESLQKIANEHHLKLIYDAAHAFGVEFQGQSLLNYGDLSVMSFHATKVFNTFEGGAIVCHSAEMKQRIDRLRNFGIVNETTIDDISLNGKLSEVHAALGLLQLKTIDQTLLARKRIDIHYREQLKEVDGILCIQRSITETDSYSYFPIVISQPYPLTRDQLFEKLKKHNIFARKYFYPIMTDLEIYKKFQSNTPNARLLSEQVLCLPMYPSLEMAQISQIINVIKDGLK